MKSSISYYTASFSQNSNTSYVTLYYNIPTLGLTKSSPSNHETPWDWQKVVSLITCNCLVLKMCGLKLLEVDYSYYRVVLIGKLYCYNTCLHGIMFYFQFVNPEQSGYVGFANLPNQVHRKSVKKGFEFTLMVVGR